MNLFVYGSLMSGMSGHHFLRGAKRIAARASVRGELYDTGKGYPGLVHGEGKVWGEVYRIDPALLKELDEYEDYKEPGHPDNLYERLEETAETERGAMRVLVYRYVDEVELKQKGKRIPSGDWRTVAKLFYGKGVGDCEEFLYNGIEE
jgi:gamma-L-glutamyl-butirosin B gamma-L-glutamyl cyclotransferase